MVESIVNDFLLNHKMNDRIQIMVDDIQIEPFKEEEEAQITRLIHRSISGFSDSEAVISAIFRRTRNLSKSYASKGCTLFVAKQKATNDLIGCVGLGPLHGLPHSEGVGEIRDLVVDERYRGLGIGSKLLHKSIKEAKKIGYQRLYLETSQNMLYAKKLFLRRGFRPVTETSPGAAPTDANDLPCYFLLENLEDNHH